MARKEDKLRPYRVDYFDISEMKENDLALVKSIVVRAVTATEAIYHDNVAQEGRIIIRAYRYYKHLGSRKKDVYKPVEDLFTANKAIKIMEAVEAYRAKPVVTIAPTEPTPPPPSLVSVPAPASGEHVTRYSDSSLYDEVCVNCGATDTSGKLEDPCPNTQKSAAVAAVARTAAEIGADPQVLAAHTIDVIQNHLSGPLSPATVAAVADLQGMISHDTHEQIMDTFVPTTPVPDGFPDLTNTAPITSFVQPDDLIEPDKAVGPAGRPRVPHWHGCACDVCETPSISGTDVTPLVSDPPLWVKFALIGVIVAGLVAIIRVFLHH